MANPAEAGVQKEPTQPVTFQAFQEAVGLFSNDYAIVGHGGEPLTSFFDEPRPHMEYTVVGEGLGEMTEADFLTELRREPIAVLIGCMDKRGAQLTYQQIKDVVLPENNLQGTRTFSFFVGGGVVQHNTVTQEGQEVVVNRAQAFRTAMNYLAEHAAVELVIATGHDHRCGAEAFAADGQGWPERLGCEPGAELEQTEMKKLIGESARQLLPQSWLQDGKVKPALVILSDNPENDPHVNFSWI